MCDSDFARASDLFDLYVDWERRLAREIPFLQQVLCASGATRVAEALDSGAARDKLDAWIGFSRSV